MAQNKNLQKLELTWIGKGEEPKLEPRILIENPEYSYGDPNTENMLIHGDNLLALKALEQDYAGKVKCIYIDPPYNTGKDFVYKDNYKDNLTNYLEQTNTTNAVNSEASGRYHTNWLNMMYPRLKLARNLLTDEIGRAHV